MDLSCSVVLYNHSIEDIQRLLKLFENSALKTHLTFVDNSEKKIDITIQLPSNVTYIHLGSNVGYGAGHNIAIRKHLDGFKYHLVLNPDVTFGDNVINELYSFMENNSDVGLVMPKVLYPDGRVQYVCKLIPRPTDLIFKRFFPKSFYTKRENVFQLKFTSYDKMMDVPYLSGCFMFLRGTALKEVGLFDERFFMYPEDIDLTRRVHRKFRTVFFPKVIIFHEHAAGSYKNIKLMYIHIVNMIKYFNKWGWFFDKERKEVNRKILKINNYNG